GVVVGCHEHGRTGPVDPVEQLHDVHRGSGVKVPGRLVCQEDQRPVDEGPGDRDALLLATGELVGVVAQFLPQPDQVQDLRHALLGDVARFSDHLQRKGDVVEHGLVREQFEVLEHGPQVPSEVRDLPRRELPDVLTGHVDVTGRGFVLLEEQPDQRRLAGARRTYYEHELALGDLQGHVVQRGHRLLVDLGDAIEADHGSRLRRESAMAEAIPSLSGPRMLAKGKASGNEAAPPDRARACGDVAVSCCRRTPSSGRLGCSPSEWERLRGRRLDSFLEGDIVPDPTSNRPELSVIVPVWNGEHRLGKLLPRLFTVLGATVKGATEVLVVLPRGDSATQVAQRAGATVVPFDPPGYGAAFNAGLAASRGKWVITMDADFSHNPEFVRTLWLRRREADVLIASRYVAGAVVDMPLSRRILSRTLNRLYRTTLALPHRD